MRTTDSVTRIIALSVLAGLIPGTYFGYQLAPGTEIRREAEKLASTTYTAVETCREVEAENRYLTSLGVGDLTRLDALGLLPYSATQREEVIPDVDAREEHQRSEAEVE